MIEAISQWVAPRLQLTLEEYHQHVRGRDWWMPGADAVNINHAADKLVPQKDTPTRLDPPGKKDVPEKEMKLPPPFSPIPSKSDEVSREVPSQDAPGVGSAPWGLDKLGAFKSWLITRDWQATMMWSIYGIIGLVAIGAWIESALSKRKTKKLWLAAKEAKLRAEDEARQAAANLAMAAAAKKTKPKRKKNGV